MDLQNPEWKGRWGGAPSGADFQAIVSAVLATQGEDATRAWLDGMHQNAIIYNNNIATMKAVNAGEVPVGVIYHYYWYRDQDGTAENSGNTELYYFGKQDPGAFVSISGGGVLKSSDRPDEAQQFLAWLAGTAGQTILGEGYSFEYPVSIGIPARSPLPALETLDAPIVDPSTLNGPDVVEADDRSRTPLTLTSTSMPARATDRKRAPAGVVVLAVVFAAAALIPVGYVVQAAVAMGWEQLAELVFRPRVGELLTNTVLLVVLGVPCTVILGVGGAWLVERTSLPARRLFAVLLVLPLTIPAFVASYGWASAIPSIHGLGGGLLIATLAYSPLVYLPALATLRGLDPALEESARSLGMSGSAVFFRVILPQLRLAILGGGLVVALHLLAEYGAFAFIRFETFTTAIVVAYQASFAGPNAAALGIVLALLCFIVLVLEAAARGRLRYARVGSGAQLPVCAYRSAEPPRSS